MSSGWIDDAPPDRCALGNGNAPSAHDAHDNFVHLLWNRRRWAALLSWRGWAGVMANVFFICVREDLAAAEVLGEMFADAGFSVSGAPDEVGGASSGASIVLWSPASCWCSAFMGAAQRALQADGAVIATLSETAPPAAFAQNAPIFDLSLWDGDIEDPALDPLFFAVDQMAAKARDEAVATRLRDHGLGTGWTASLPSGRIASPRRLASVAASVVAGHAGGA